MKHTVIIESTIAPPISIAIRSKKAKKMLKAIECKFNVLNSVKKLNFWSSILDFTNNDVLPEADYTQIIPLQLIMRLTIIATQFQKRQYLLRPTK
jgi:hypothetical protein